MAFPSDFLFGLNLDLFDGEYMNYNHEWFVYQGSALTTLLMIQWVVPHGEPFTKQVRLGVRRENKYGVSDTHFINQLITSTPEPYVG